MENIRETLQVAKERAILVAAVREGRFNDNLAELTALAESAGAVVVDRFQQRIKSIHPGRYIGKGKADELAQRVKTFEADVVIFDNDLSPGQIRELEKIVEIKVLDRSELILDIFATRARTKQAKLQVSLAQLEYTYPRLTRMWSHLDTVTGAAAGGIGAVGGIGTRGTGESQLEIDRRIVQKRITELKRELVEIDKRKMREIKGREGIFTVGIVGYTNAGKSTLMNRLTEASVFVEDRLFATLDTRTKKWNLGGGIEVLLSDTVGFVRNLPHQLVASFKATLEEAINADLLIHVVDVANPESIHQINSVERVLNEIGCGGKPMITVLNKADAVTDMSHLQTISTMFPDAVCMSAKTGLGVDELAAKVLEKYRGGVLFLRVRANQSNGKVQSFLRAHGTVVNEEYDDGFVQIEVRLGNNQLVELKRLKPDSLEYISR